MERVLIRGYNITPKKGDLAIVRKSYMQIWPKYDYVIYYGVEYVTKGGKKPRNEYNSPIDPKDIVAVVRPGWKVDGVATGDTIEETVKSAWEQRIRD